MLRTLRSRFSLGSCAVSVVLAALAACKDDDGGLVRPRPDGGGWGDAGVSGVLACGVRIPATYVSPNFATNAKDELALRANVAAIDTKMRATEGNSTAILTAAELMSTYASTEASLRAASTPGAQAIIDGYLAAYGDAIGRAWTPAQADVDGGARAGGKYEGTFHFSAVGVDLREATTKTILGGALYNRALQIALQPMSEAAVDRLVVLFGASAKLANRTDEDAGADADVLIAEYASRRDDKTQTTPGAYRRIQNALLSAKAAAAAGDSCRSDFDAAVKVYFAEWERTTYATVIYYLNQAAMSASASPPKGPPALHAFGEALGLVQSFRGLPEGKRVITDAQIDALLAKIGAETAWQLVTRSTERASAFVSAIQDVAGIYGFSQADVESFKKAY